MTVELTRLVPLSKIGPAGFGFVVQATPGECAALARRMDIPGVQDLTCAFSLTRDDVDHEVVIGMGHLHAQVTRVCVVSTEEFGTAVEDHFEVRFVPAGQEHDEPDSDPDREDEIPYEGDWIDLGDAAAEQLALALDPYPRMDGAKVPDHDDGEDKSPFAALARRNEGMKTGD